MPEKLLQHFWDIGGSVSLIFKLSNAGSTQNDHSIFFPNFNHDGNKNY